MRAVLISLLNSFRQSKTDCPDDIFFLLVFSPSVLDMVYKEVQHFILWYGESRMNKLKIMILVLEVLLVISIGYIVIVTLYNGELEQETSIYKNELLVIKESLNDTEGALQETRATLEEVTEQLNTSQNFTTAFFTAEGTFRLARSIKETADASYLSGGNAYNGDQWDTAISYFNQSLTNYSVAGQEYRDAEELFTNAQTYTANTIYQDLCSTYAKLCVSASNRTYFLSKASEYMKKACEFYEEEKISEGSNEVNKANVRINEHADEVEIYNALYTEINEILMQLG